jgi:hypothetical protein
MLKITGLTELQQDLENAQRAFQALDGEIGSVRFDPNSPQSVEAAIVSMEALIDEKISPYRGNALVENIIPQMKERYRAVILERAGNAQQAEETIGE